jgi:hypothetical protein
VETETACCLGSAQFLLKRCEKDLPENGRQLSRVYRLPEEKMNKDWQITILPKQISTSLNYF